MQGISRSGLLTAGKVYKKTYDIVANRGGSLSIASGSTTINIDSAVGVGTFTIGGRYIYLAFIHRKV